VLDGSFGNRPTMAAGRFSGQSVHWSEGNNGNFLNGYLPMPAGAIGQTAFGFAFNADGLNSGTKGTWALYNGGTILCGFNFDTNGRFNFYRLTDQYTGTLLGSTANNIILTATWYYIEAEIVLGSSTGTFKLYVNGVKVMDLSGLNNVNGSLVTADRFYVNLNSPGGNFYMDDFYLTDTATRIGECRVETLRPSADTATKQFAPNSGTANFSRVNETLVDGDTSYVQASAVGNRDLYSLGALSATPASIYAVNVVSFAEKTDATSRTLYNSVQSNSTDSDGVAQTLLSSYARLDRIMETDPSGGGAWSAARVNALLVGPKVAS
jgi:hypothetical protein